MKKLYVLLPCYNEAENIGELLEEWEKQRNKLEKNNFELEIRVINDASKDNTVGVVKEKKKKYNNIEILEHEVNKGLCGGINTAVNYFYKNASKTDLLVIMDGDNTQNPKYVHDMLEKIKQGNDCVIASRYQKGAKVKGLAMYREKLSDIASIYYKLVLNIKDVKDYTCGYRVYTYNIIEKLVDKFGEEVVKEKSFACMMELLYKVSRAGAKFDEVPFELRYDNKKGTSKMNVFTTMRRSVITAIKLQFKYNKKTVILNSLIAIFLILLPLLLSFATNYSPTNKSGTLHDCGIFSYIGFAMQNGLFMYTGAWDNKGPLLYFIYYVGLKFAGEFGVYIIEYLALLVTTIFGYKTVKLVSKSKILGIVGSLYSLCLWIPTSEQGTLSEVFALPFTMIGIYLFAKCILNNLNLSKKEIIIWGFCSAGLTLLRLNILLIFLPLFIIIAIVLVKQKRIKEIPIWILYGLIGFLIFMIPMVIYLIVNNSLVECLNSAYLQIMSGFNTGTGLDKFLALKKMMIQMNDATKAGILMILFVFVSIGLMIAEKVKNKNICYLLIGTILMIIINMYANSLSGAVQMHYFITFIPIVFLVTALLLYGINEHKDNKIIKISGIIVILIGIAISGINYYNMSKDIITKATSSEGMFTQLIRNYILENSEPTDKVQMIGGGNESVTANYKTRRLSPTRYNYLPLWNSFKDERKAEIVNEVTTTLMQEKPKIIMICENVFEKFNSLIDNKENWDEFLSENYEIDNESILFYTIYKKKSTYVD